MGACGPFFALSPGKEVLGFRINDGLTIAKAPRDIGTSTIA
jgi:hypothetical protein